MSSSVVTRVFSVLALIGVMSLVVFSLAREDAKVIHTFSGIFEFGRGSEAVFVFHSFPADRFNFDFLIERYESSISVKPGCSSRNCEGYALEFRDSSGTSLKRRALRSGTINSTFSTEDGRIGGSAEIYLEGYILNLPDYHSYALLKDGEELTAVKRSAHAPTASISGISKNQIIDGNEAVMFSLSVEDKDGDDLTYQLFKTDEDNNYEQLQLANWSSFISAGTSSAEIKIPNFHFSKTDAARVAVSVSDGTHSVLAETPTFTIGERPPIAQIIKPQESRKHLEITGIEPQLLDAEENTYDATGRLSENGCRTIDRACLLLSGFGRDFDERQLSSNRDAYSWSSNIDGHLGIGSTLRISSHELTLGLHTITFTWTNSQGISATDTVDIFIEQASSATPN